MERLNLGCGSSCHPDWVNLDLVPSCPMVKACDLRKGIPYPNGSIDACYSSHVLEHMDAKQGAAFLLEQFRVLRRGGIIRVVVPDLETICRNYLRYLGSGDNFRYEYSVLEMFDQTTRKESGGDLGRLWQSGTIKDLDFVLSRHGEEARPHIRTTPPEKEEPRDTRHTEAQNRVLGFALALLGDDGRDAVAEGLFRASGEIHRKMYDRFSLGRALDLAGFTDIRVCAHNESMIEGFTDTGLDGTKTSARKPDSLYMEASKV